MDFKHGAFSIAKEANVRILPIYVHGCQEGHALNWICAPADLTLVYGTPFEVENPITSFSSFENDRSRVKLWMEAEMKMLNAVNQTQQKRHD
jgi:hypothetical protein